jgi:hypothetical protein
MSGEDPLKRISDEVDVHGHRMAMSNQQKHEGEGVIWSEFLTYFSKSTK